MTSLLKFRFQQKGSQAGITQWSEHREGARRPKSVSSRPSNNVERNTKRIQIQTQIQVTVIKAIKLFRENLEPWIQKSDIQALLNLKNAPNAQLIFIFSLGKGVWSCVSDSSQVVHLIRDPRAILGSRATALWAREHLEAPGLCRQMQENMDLARSIPPDRWRSFFKKRVSKNSLIWLLPEVLPSCLQPMLTGADPPFL